MAGRKAARPPKSLFIFAVGRAGEAKIGKRGTGQVMLLLVGSSLGVREKCHREGTWLLR